MNNLLFGILVIAFLFFLRWLIKVCQLTKENLADKERGKIILSQRDRDRFLDAIMFPPKPNDNVKRAVERHRRDT